jgi:hypothetical protein
MVRFIVEDVLGCTVRLSVRILSQPLLLAPINVSMYVPEVFLPLRNSRSAYRSKINEIVDATLTRLNRSNGDNNAS